jgi:hypothetical protein
VKVRCHFCFLHSSIHNPILQIYVGTFSHGRAPDYGLYINISFMIFTRAESSYIIYGTHTVEVYPNCVVHRGNRGAPSVVHEQKRQRTCKRNIEARLRDHCCRGNVKIGTHSECVCVCSISYPARKAHTSYNVICGLSGSTIFSTLSDMTFGRKLLNVQCVFDYFYNFCS